MGGEERREGWSGCSLKCIGNPRTWAFVLSGKFGEQSQGQERSPEQAVCPGAAPAACPAPGGGQDGTGESLALQRKGMASAPKNVGAGVET